MFGGQDGVKSSGKIWLDNGNYERNRTDQFDVEVAEMLSPLHHIDVGHDDSGAGPGWYLDKVCSLLASLF